MCDVDVDEDEYIMCDGFDLAEEYASISCDNELRIMEQEHKFAAILK